MSSELLRRAAQTMRREESPFFDRLAELLEAAEPYTSLPRPQEYPFGVKAVAVAEAYLTDPGDIPAGAS